MTGDPSDVTKAPLGALANRVRLGASPATPRDALNQLATDPALTVRAAVAINPGAPPQADQLLASDPDERVRLLLARKVLAALPDLTQAEQELLSERTTALLFALVRDEALRIRTFVAEMLAALPGVPHALILLLAHDSDIPVSEPVLRLSPLLTVADLLALLRDPPHAATSHAIAGRRNLPADAADVIAASADDAAIQALLANPSAVIRENTLDALIARAQDQPQWQEPLVRRPSLPPDAARALSEIIASQWLQVLTERPDLPPGLASELRQRLWARLAGDHPVDSHIADQAVLRAALQLAAKGLLDEATLLDAIHAGDTRRATAILSVAAGMPMPAVDRAAAMRSAKALVSLVWKAGFSMRAAVAVQSLLGRLGPAGMLSGSGVSFPLATEEMGWQLDLLTRINP